MKRTHKKVLGVLGLALVVGMTVFAAALPGPEASAVGQSSVTDHLNVRVTGVVPDVSINNIEDGEVVVTPVHSFSVDYANVDNITVTLKYTDENGEVHEYTIASFTPEDATGTHEFNIDLDADDYGYGDYVLTVRGTSNDGVKFDEDFREFSYYALDAEVTEDENTGNYEIDLDYAPDDGTEEGGQVAEIVVNVYDENGNPVEGVSPLTVEPPTTKVELPFADLGLPSGTYTVVISAYNADGDKLFRELTYTIKYNAIEVPNTADTGQLLQSLNISKSDFLITGLIVFFLAAFAGIIAIIRSGNRKAQVRADVRSKSRRRR